METSLETAYGNISQHGVARSYKRNPDLQFTGNGFEYFKIWIVNVALTILTLGIYSAWAKVRRKRYLYGNTLLDGNAFEYTANPLSILKGRAIAFGVFLIYMAIVNFYPFAEFSLWLIFLLAIPWILIKALKFNAGNSAYRHIHFGFDATYKDALFAFIVFPISIFFTFGLSYPWLVYRQTKFLTEHYSYGRSPFGLDARIAEYYKIFGVAILLLFGLFSLLVLPVIHGIDFRQLVKEAEQPSALLWISFASVFLVYLYFFAFLRARLENLFWSCTDLEKIRFNSQFRATEIFWLYLSNTIAIVLSLGLFIPWACIRIVGYRIEHLTLESAESMDHFFAGEQEKTSATGEEVGEFFDLDFSM